MRNPITPRAGPAALDVQTACHRIRLATKGEEIAARKLHPQIEFSVLILVSSPQATVAIPYSLPAGVELRLPTDPTVIEWIAQDRHTVLEMSDGGFELIGLPPGVTADMVQRRVDR